MTTANLRVRALKTDQADTQVFAFFTTGAMLMTIAEISRLRPGEDGIVGFQRPEIRSHVREIVAYLDRGNVLFPNAIILALAPGVRFTAARGTKPSDVAQDGGEAGTLSIPLSPGKKPGWIVDGQQRTLALAESSNQSVLVPVVAFVSRDLGVHREQFVLVNRAKPLPARLIDELLPVVGSELPRDLSVRRVPSALCNTLNTAPESPLRGLVRRSSSEGPLAVITDSALLKSIQRSIQDPRGGLAPYVGSNGQADMDEMFRRLIAYWSAVRDVFPHAWGKTAEKSRLMHAAGIEAMGLLMDQICGRLSSRDDVYAASRAILEQIAPACRWTSGRWEMMDRDWNDVQCTSRDIKALSKVLLTLERAAFHRTAA